MNTRNTLALIALLAAASACNKDTKPETKSAPTPPPVVANAVKADPQVDTADGATRHVAGDHFALDLAAKGCKVGVECTLTIKLAVEGAFHVNKEYPYRFIATETPGVDFLGKTDKTKFTKEAGDFVADGNEKGGTMTVRFKPSAAGKTKIAGTYKMSVCSADQCQIEEPSLDIVIPAS